MKVGGPLGPMILGLKYDILSCFSDFYSFWGVGGVENWRVPPKWPPNFRAPPWAHEENKNLLNFWWRKNGNVIINHSEAVNMPYGSYFR